MPLLVTPLFPEYPSRHSMVSTTAATVLAERFGNDITFDVNSDVMAGVIRHFTSFSAALGEVEEFISARPAKMLRRLARQ